MSPKYRHDISRSGPPSKLFKVLLEVFAELRESCGNFAGRLREVPSCAVKALPFLRMKVTAIAPHERQAREGWCPSGAGRAVRFLHEKGMLSLNKKGNALPAKERHCPSCTRQAIPFLRKMCIVLLAQEGHCFLRNGGIFFFVLGGHAL